MYTPDYFLRDSLAVFDSQNLEIFREFLGKFPTKKWILASDYNWHQVGRPQDVIAFTLYPQPFTLISENKIGELFREDFKKIKSVPERTQLWYRSGAAFHICFVLEQQASFFHSAGTNRLEIVRDSLRATVDYLINANAPTHILTKYRELLRQSRSPSFNVRIWSDVLFLSVCYSFIVGLLAREDRLEFLLWCSDRDAMTTWNSGILFDIALVQAVRYAHKFGPLYDAKHLPFLILTQDKSAKLYDHVIRPADYLASAISAWSLRTNSTTEGAQKYSDMLAGAIAENDYISHINVEMGKALMHVRGLRTKRAVIESNISSGPTE